MNRITRFRIRDGVAVGLVLAALAWSTMLTPAHAAGNVYKLKVDGLACPFCAYGIEKQLRAVPGVSGVKISVKSGRVIVTMRDGTKLTRTVANGAVKRAGFSLAGFSK